MKTITWTPWTPWTPEKNKLLQVERNISFEDEVFLKMIIPSRKATKTYWGGPK